MEDLDYSVRIAERDWESFYEESEECSIPQTWLASPDDSGFSDTDDEKKCTQVPGVDLQIGDHKLLKEPNAVTKRGEEVNNEGGTMSEEPGSDTDNRSATHTTQINLNDVSTTRAGSASDSGVIDTIYPNQQHTEWNIRDYREQNENSTEEKANPKPVLRVWENSPKKEKERWFVTVNDGSVKQKGKSGQKKGRKKKTCRKRVRRSLVPEKHCSVSNNNKDRNHKPRLQNECVQPSETFPEHMDPFPDPFTEEFLLDSGNDKELVFSPTKGHEKAIKEKTSVPEMKRISEASSSSSSSSSTVKEENPRCVFNLKCKADSDVSTETSNSNSLRPRILTDCLQLQTEAVAMDQNISATSPDPLVNINSIHQASEKHQAGDPPLIQEANISSPENQEHPTQTPVELSSQETLQNHGSQTDGGPNGPVYALSSFWEEMEKLTINDLLFLRSVDNRCPTSRSVLSDESDLHMQSQGHVTSKHDRVQENGWLDGWADSDYFTHGDESKAERSSCELSVFSDCDEEFVQIPTRNENSCYEPHYVKEQEEGLMSTDVPDHEVHLNTETEMLDILKQNNPDETPHDLNPTVLSFGQTVDNQSMFTFLDTLVTDITGVMCLDRHRRSAVVSCPFLHRLSGRLYHDFFSDFAFGKFLFLPPQYKSVPIFKASHSVVKELVVPLDFHPDFKQVNIHTRDLSHPCSQTETFRYSLGTPNLSCLMSQRGNWNSLFSHRRISFIGKGSTWQHTDSSWMNEAKKECVSTRVRIAPVIEVGGKSFLRLVEPEHHAGFIPKKDNFNFSIKQADMCLVCIAFASWVLKSTSIQSTDTWKAALLANVSAISAIQYLRKYDKGQS